MNDEGEKLQPSRADIYGAGWAAAALGSMGGDPVSVSGDDHGHTGEARMIGRPWTEADGIEEPPPWLPRCRHCGRLGSDPDGDHSCPCPHPDATCPDHPAEVSS